MNNIAICMHRRMNSKLCCAVVLIVICLLFFVSSSAMSAQRVALVIGNSNYAHVPVLPNPRNDASDIGAALERLGFAVTRLENADRNSLWQGLQEFKRAASVSKVAAVFYAGHGIEVDQRNFLVPVDARLASDQDVEFETVPLDLVMRALDGASELRLVILDACRDNPFAAKMQRSGATRSIGRGLARLEPSEQTLVAYSAEAGTVASDGDGRNSPYTEALLRHIEEPGLELDLMFRHVRDSVLSSTGGSQRPFTYGSLSSQGTYLTGRPAVESTVVSGQSGSSGGVPTEPNSGSFELAFWDSIKNSKDPADFQAYLTQFPSGTFTALARNNIERLKSATEEQKVPDRTQVAAITQASIESLLELSRSERRKVQEGLAVAGFDPGAADGLFGQRTRVAIGRWQLSGGADKTGYLDAKSARVLIALAAEFVPVRSPGDVFRDCKSCPQMVVVPAGDYMMGSPSSEQGRSDNESPRHRVTISKPFAVGKYEVTFSQWDACVAEGGCSHRPSDKSWGRSERPVIYVSWNDTKEYVKWLIGKTGNQYRLLSESEWEYVARAGTTGPFHFGGTISSNQANYNGEYVYGSGRKGMYRGKTVSVGSFPSNGYGLHDVHGNVWEWVEDCWHDSYAGAPTDGRAWTTGGYCGHRVLRGGSWTSEAEGLARGESFLGWNRAPEQQGRIPSCPDAYPLNLYLWGSKGRSPLVEILFTLRR